MSLLNRMSDIVNANMNAMLEKAEDPEKMIRLITQEMQDTLVEVRATTVRHLADKKAINQQIDTLRATSNDWETRANLAIERDRDDLAKAALAERRSAETAIAQLAAELTTLDTSLSNLTDDTQRLEDKLQQARSRQKAVILRGATAKSRMQVKRQLHSPRHDDTLLKFEAYERRLDDMEGQLEAWELGESTQRQSLHNEINGLHADALLEAELAALKAKQPGAESARSIPSST
ncbi:MAG: phage shock protein A [Candidatus Pseudothioglobus sp.]|jgi:phage shock protein A